jgi:hypothetical protein
VRSWELKGRCVRERERVSENACGFQRPTKPELCLIPLRTIKHTSVTQMCNRGHWCSASVHSAGEGLYQLCGCLGVGNSQGLRSIVSGHANAKLCRCPRWSRSNLQHTRHQRERRGRVEAEQFQELVGSREQQRVREASQRLRPLPRAVAVAKHQPVRHLQALPELIRVEVRPHLPASGVSVRE